MTTIATASPKKTIATAQSGRLTVSPSVPTKANPIVTTERSIKVMAQCKCGERMGCDSIAPAMPTACQFEISSINYLLRNSLYWFYR